MELERIPLGFRDLVAYTVPGFVSLLAILLAGWLGPVERLSTYHPGVLIVVGTVGSYIVGHAVYFFGAYLIREARRRAGDPRTYLIGSVQGRSKFLPPLFPRSKLGASFKSALVAELEAYWGQSLVNETPFETYQLCALLIRKRSPAYTYYLDRYISLRNMHGAMVFPTVFLAIVLFIKLQAILLGALCLMAAMIFFLRSHSNMITGTKLVYLMFYILQREAMPKEESDDEMR